MAFYDLSQEQRQLLVDKINSEILSGIKKGKSKNITACFSDEDTYIRKAAYLAIGKIYKENKDIQVKILQLLDALFESENEKIRQTAIIPSAMPSSAQSKKWGKKIQSPF